MRFFLRGLASGFVLLAMAAPQYANGQMQPYPDRQGDESPSRPDAAEQLFALANQARADLRLGRLAWDPALAEAALAHCRLMARKGPIAHQYQGEPDLSDRAAQAGAHFSLIEENVAVGPTAAAIHDEWMHSPGHRDNLLNAQVNRLGVAVVFSHGVLYAVEDFSEAVLPLKANQVEAQVASLIRPSGVSVLDEVAAARAACRTSSGLPRDPHGREPRFVMRWQSADLKRLPQVLVQKLGSGQYHEAAVGGCPAQNQNSAFTAYRVAVLLY